jgi:hypothetical protein
MALSFFYLAFVQVLQLLRLFRYKTVNSPSRSVVMLRHEVASPKVSPASGPGPPITA